MQRLKIDILSREAIENLILKGIPENTVVISFSDPITNRTPADYTSVVFPDNCKVFKVAVHDIDIEILEDYGLTYETYLPEANDLARFIIEAEKSDMNIICQCEYGQSRSAACAAAIKEYYDHSGITVFADYRYYPNQVIFNKILEALKNNKRDIL